MVLEGTRPRPAARTDLPTLRSARHDRAEPPAVRTFRPDIEGLRAVAVTLVVLSHLSLVFPGGYVGVDVFFVISGFLITRQLASELARTNRISFSRFYARRMRRILPAATVVIVGTLLACWRWDSPLQVKSESLDALFSAFSGVNWRLARNGTNYFLSTAPPSPFQHFWSLSVEEQFYAVWPVLLLVTGLLAGRASRHRSSRRKPLVWSLLAIMAGSLALSAVTTSGSLSWAYFGIQTRAWELAFGALLAVTVDVWTRMPPALASQMSWLGLGLIAVAACCYSGYTGYPGLAVVLPVVGAAFVIAGGCPGWSRSSELILMRRPARFVGRVSYSWYLVHWPMLTIMPLATGHPLTLGRKMFVLLGSLALAVALFYLVEQPIRDASLLVRRPRFGLALGGVLVAASIGSTLLVSDLVVIPGGTGPVRAVTAASGLRVVDNALAAAVKLTRLPAAVTPSLAGAPSDVSFTTAACLESQDPTAPPPIGQCTFGDLRARRTLVVVGDSHANAWAPAFNAFAQTYHWRFVLYAKAACPPGVYPTYVSPATSQVYTECNEWRGNLFARLRDMRPDVILVTSELRTIDVNPAGMVQTIREFEGTAARVIYLEDTPEPNQLGSVPDCLAKNPDDIQRCSLARSDPTSRLNAFAPRQMEATAVMRAGAVLIDPSVWFCTASTCPPVIDNIIVYCDDTHPTATYTRWLSPVLGAALEKAIGGKRA